MLRWIGKLRKSKKWSNRWVILLSTFEKLILLNLRKAYSSCLSAALFNIFLISSLSHWSETADSAAFFNASLNVGSELCQLSFVVPNLSIIHNIIFYKYFLYGYQQFSRGSWKGSANPFLRIPFSIPTRQLKVQLQTENHSLN